MKAYASDMFNISALFTKRGWEIKNINRVRAVKGSVLNDEVKVFIWILDFSVAFNDRVSVVRISRYDFYDLILSKCLFAGFIELDRSCGAPFGRKWNGNMSCIEGSAS